MSHLTSTLHRRGFAKPAALAALAATALGVAGAGPARGDPGPCGGNCPKRVTVYRDTFAYSTPYFDARSRHPLAKGTSYVATCEARSSSSGRYDNHWWSRLREGTWVNNGDLVGAEKMQLGDCPAPADDGSPAGRLPTLKRCRDSDWMTRTGGLGTGASFVASLQPTFRARVFGRSRNFRGKKYLDYIWRDLKRCVHFPRDLTAAQTESLYKQLACHAQFAVARPLGGNTWDLEAKRPNVSWIRALNPASTCNW
jgi:hypothetical protein